MAGVLLGVLFALSKSNVITSCSTLSFYFSVIQEANLISNEVEGEYVDAHSCFENSTRNF